MKKAIDQLCSKIAACAFTAAVVSSNTASYNGLYEPKMPEQLRK